MTSDSGNTGPPRFRLVLALVVIGTLAAVWLGISSLTCTIIAGALTAIGMRYLAASEWRQHESITRQYRDLQENRDEWKVRWTQLDAESVQTLSVISQMRDGVIVLSIHEVILLANPSAMRLLTIGTEVKVVGRMLGEVARYPNMSKAIQACLNHLGTQEAMIDVPLSSGHRPIRVRVERIGYDNDQRILLTLTDETETRRIDGMRREFIANVSHELKTPLAAIKGYAETVELAIEDDPAAASHFLSQIRTQCQRLERLVADMMQLARAQSGREHLRFVAVSLGDVIAESLKSYRPIASAKQIELSVDAANQSARVTADKEAMLTIVNNLIGNAIRYTPAGGHVNVGIRAADSYWSLYVSDDGEGIPDSEHERIFERFYRVEKTRESALGGTGLGLSIVKNLVNAHGGEVRLTSQLGQGSTFEVLLKSAGV
jgi:two-component system phosphate regulon sensor histidine kinase PhoR